MFSQSPVTLLNTGLPLLILGLEAFTLPRLILSRETRSHQALIAVLFISLVLLLLTAIGLFAFIQMRSGADLAGSVAADPVGTGAILIRPALLSGIFWLPLLALAGFNLAQRVERLRGQDMLTDHSEWGIAP